MNKETIDSSTSRCDPAIQAELRDLEERAVHYQALATDFEHRYEKKRKMVDKLCHVLSDELRFLTSFSCDMEATLSASSQALSFRQRCL